MLLAASVGVTQLKADGVPASELVLGESQARDGGVVLAEHFPAGSGSPLYVIVSEGDAPEAAELVAGQDGVDSVGVVADDTPSGQAAVSVEGGTPSSACRNSLKRSAPECDA